MTEAPEVQTFQVIYPDGEIMEFEAALPDLRYSESPDGGFDLSGPLQIKAALHSNRRIAWHQRMAGMPLSPEETKMAVEYDEWLHRPITGADDKK